MGKGGRVLAELLKQAQVCAEVLAAPSLAPLNRYHRPKRGEFKT